LPASVIVADVVKPSGRNSFTLLLSPSTATLSLINWPPFSQMRPPTMIASGCFAAMPWKRAW